MTRFGWLGGTAESALKRGSLVLLLALMAAAGSIAFTSKHLAFKTSRQDLLNPASEFHHRWLAYADEFGATADVVIVVEGQTAEQVAGVTAEVGRALRDQPEHFCDVLDGFDAEPFIAKGLYYLPDPLLKPVERFVQQAVPLVADPHMSLSAALQLANDGRELQACTTLGPRPLASTASETTTTNRPTTSATPFPESSETALALAAPDRSWAQVLGARFAQQLGTEDGRSGIVLTRLVQEPSAFVPSDEPFVALEAIARRLAEDHTGVRIGLTGLPVLERDEMRTSQQDMTWASVLSVIGVALMMGAGVGGLKYPLLGALTLLSGIAWSCGYLTLVVGHLNILSMSFGVILIGMGIDFSIHFVARYLHARRSACTTDAALNAALRQSGPPIMAGAVTTAAAFFAIALTEFRGVAELGIIAGGGILLCALATLLLLPSAIRLVDRSANPSPAADLPAMDRVVACCWKRPVRTTVIFTLVSALLTAGLSRLEYDHNLLNLQASGLPSVYWEKRLLDRSDRNAVFAVSVADSLEEVRRRTREFQQLESVERVEELASLLPQATEERTATIRRIRRRLLEVSESPPVLQAVAVPPPETDAARTIAAYTLWRSLTDLKAISNPQPPGLNDVPGNVRRRLVGRSGKHLMRVYARDDIWQAEPLQRFVSDLERVDSQVTGDPVQAHYASHQMQSSYVRAAALAALAVLVILSFVLRSPCDIVLAALPTTLGLAQLFGLMGWLGIALNPANIIVLPLLIGIGIDDGIHVVHEWRLGSGTRRPTRATTIGVTLTSLTSMIGFGSLMLAQHEGLRSLGRVATLGITCCMLTSLVLLPCVLGLMERTGGRASRRAPIMVT